MRQAKLGTLLFALTALTFAAHAQQQNITITVVDAHADPTQPVQSVTVSLSYLDGSARVTDARRVTNRDGQVRLQLSPDAGQRGDLRIEIANASNLTIYQPADGQLPALPSTLTVRLLPKGSAALLGPAQIEATLRRALLQVNSLNQQNRALKQELANAPPPKQDLSEALADWARESGFTTADVDTKVQQWGHDIQLQAGAATCQQKALAQLALKNNDAAAAQFTQCFQTQLASLDDDEKAFLDARRKKLSSIVATAQQAVDADYLALHFNQATAVIDQVVATTSAEYKKHSGDRGFHELWLQALAASASARWHQGMFAGPAESMPLLVRSSQVYIQLIEEYAELGNHQEEASADLGLANTYVDQGTRVGAAESARLLEKSVQACKAALSIYTRADFPDQWVKAQNHLGNAYLSQGQRAAGPEADTLLADAVQAFQSALEVSTKAGSPHSWASAQNGLGQTYAAQVRRTSGPEATALLQKAVQAYEHSLEVRTRAEMPQQWASTQNNLANAYMAQGQCTSGAESVALLGKAVQTYNLALQVGTKADVPQQWAVTQNNLGVAYTSQAERTSGPQSLASLDQAVQAYQHVLEVYTRAELPQQWAAAQNNLGLTYSLQAQRSAGPDATPLYQKAVNSFQHALEVETQADLPQQWATVQINLGNAYLFQARSASGTEQAALAASAQQAYERALQVYTIDRAPKQWIITEPRLGLALSFQHQDDAAAKAFDSVLAINPKSIEALQFYASLLHGHLHDYARAFELAQQRLQLDPSANAQMAYIESALTAGKFAACLDKVAAIADAAIASAKVPVRDTIKLACQWGAAQAAAALPTQQSLLANASSLQKGQSKFPGTLRYLSESPVFASGRDSWIGLFTAIQSADPAAYTAALHQLEPLLQPTVVAH